MAATGGPTRAGVTAPAVTRDAVTFRLPDPHHRLRGVRLAQDLHLPVAAMAFTHRRGTWSLTLARPDVDRMEYLFELEESDGERHTLLDAANPDRAPGAFGDRSVVTFPGYVPPAWLDSPRVDATSTDLAVPSQALGATVRGQLWSPVALGAREPAPLLVVHDGPDVATFARFLDWAAAMIAAGTVPPLRVALLAPGDRNRWYAVNPAYARALTGEVLPAVVDVAPSTVRIGVGASLGALAMLHAHRSRPGSFDALFLQSGSFFRPDLDPQERRFARFGPVTRFVAETEQAVTDPDPVPVVMTCGTLEENLANNRALVPALRRLGYPVHLAVVRDVHTMTAWRDALDPHLTGLVYGMTA